MLNAIYYLNHFRNAACSGMLSRASQAPYLLAQSDLPRLNLVRGNILSPTISSAYLSSGRRPEKLSERVLITPSSPFRSDSTYQNYARMRWLHLWAGVGGLLAAFLLKRESDFFEKAYCDEASPSTNTDFFDRANIYISPEKSAGSRACDEVNEAIDDPLKLGLVLYKDRISRREYFKITKISRFYAQLINGQLVWISFGEFNLKDVQMIADFYKNLNVKRSLHINIWFNRNLREQIAMDFIIKDVTKFCQHSISLHIMSFFDDALAPQELPSTDILNLWFFSIRPKGLNEIMEVSGREIGSVNKENLSVPFTLKEVVDCFK